MNGRRLKRCFRFLFPGIADCVLPAIFALLNPQARPGILLKVEKWLDCGN